MGVGAYHTIVFTSDKDCYSFGKNKNGQLGTGDRINKFFPVRIDFGDVNVSVLDIGGGSDFSAIVNGKQNQLKNLKKILKNLIILTKFFQKMVV